MILSHSRSFLCLLVVSLTGLIACKSDSVQTGGGGSAAAISPAPPTFNDVFKARNPRVCAKVTHVPSVAEAAVMAQCDYEANSNAGGSSPVFMLATDVVVQMGSSKAYNPAIDSYWDSIDPASPVYALRGSSTGYSCTPENEYNRGKNCSKSFGGEVGTGACWHTQFGEWHCRMTMGGKNQELQIKGPTTF